MRRVASVMVGLVLVVLGLVGPAAPGAAAPPEARPGAAGIGDPYFPLDGNGGYDVLHYDLAVDYRPATDRLRGRARITARATQALSRFNLDLQGLQVDRVRVDGRRASWTRDGQELRVTPRKALRAGQRFEVVVRYHGVPLLLDEPALGRSGVFPTADGALVVGQPHVAATWFPVNDHPLDKATYRVAITVPRGLEAVSNGRLVQKRHHGRSSTWTWVMAQPMASYLATATVGQFRLTRDRVDGIKILDAIDPVLFAGPAPRTGDQFVGSGAASSGYQRLSRVVAVPAGGGRMTFWVDRSTEPEWDFFLVEARPVGSEAWTTLPDLAGHTSPSTGVSCPAWLELHPFLRHYQTAAGDGEACAATGSTGRWNAATGASEGYEQWSVDLGAYAGRAVELSLSVVSDDVASYRGVYVDDVVVPGGDGSTSFEADADPLDGWRVSSPPAGSPGNTTDWRLTREALSPSTGARAAAALDQQPEILRFLSGVFGPYPFRDAGGIVDDDPDIGFALENQTRPIYSKVFFSGPVEDDSTSVVVHELAHQWTGNSLAVEAWQHIWLNEGFATYAEWLWAEERGTFTPQQVFDFLSALPADDPFWTTVIGDPGPEHLFDGPVYDRGGMTLHALRLQIGDDRFFTLLQRWTATQRGGNVTTGEFQALAEQVSGQDLDAFFRAWLFTGSKPAGLGAPPATSTRAAAGPGAELQRKLSASARR